MTLLLAIDTGNTQTVIGLYKRVLDARGALIASDGLVDHWRLSTDAARTSDEYAVLLRNFLDTAGYDMDTEVSGVAVCSGVPRVLANLRQMVARYFTFDAVVIEPGTKTGIPILYDSPKEVGADRIATRLTIGCSAMRCLVNFSIFLIKSLVINFLLIVSVLGLPASVQHLRPPYSRCLLQ